MGKIRVLSDNLANQIAAGEVVERPASVAKELLENALDAGAKRITIDIEAGGRRLLRISDDGEGMVRDDAVLAFERHATSKIRLFEDLSNIVTLGFRGEALASIASVAKVELTTKTETEKAATRVQIEGGKLVDVSDAARPTGTTICVRDLFFNVPARRKFLRSEATENFHLINLVQHYALANPSKAFILNNNGREIIRLTAARDVRERAFQIFGSELIESLLNVAGGNEFIAKVSGYVSAPRERRSTRDSQYFFINGRFVRDKILSKAISEGFRAILPHGVFPVAILFLEIPFEEVDVNVHPAKTEVRFRRAEAVKETVAEAIRKALVNNGFVAEAVSSSERIENFGFESLNEEKAQVFEQTKIEFVVPFAEESPTFQNSDTSKFKIPSSPESVLESTESEIVTAEEQPINDQSDFDIFSGDFENSAQNQVQNDFDDYEIAPKITPNFSENQPIRNPNSEIRNHKVMPPVDSASKLVKEIAVETLSTNIRPLGQLHESFIIAVDDEGLLLIDQHVAHERILFDKFRHREGIREVKSQNLLLPETFDLSPSQVAAFDLVADELEKSGFGLMRLSGRTVAIKSVPADLPQSEARNLLSEILETVDAEKRGNALETIRDDIAATMACKAAVKINMILTPEKMQWMIDRLVLTSAATTCPHGRPIVLRLTMKDIERGFHRT